MVEFFTGWRFSGWEWVTIQSLSLDKLRDWLDSMLRNWLVSCSGIGFPAQGLVLCWAGQGQVCFFGSGFRDKVFPSLGIFKLLALMSGSVNLLCIRSWYVSLALISGQKCISLALIRGQSMFLWLWFQSQSVFLWLVLLPYTTQSKFHYSIPCMPI